MQTFPELQTVFLVCCVANLVTTLGLLLVHATNRTYPGFREWALASAAACGSVVLLAIRALLPDRPSIILVNLAFFAYPLLLASGFRQFAGRPPQKWIAPVVLTVVALVAAALTYLHPDPNARVFILSLLLVLLFSECARLVRGVQPAPHPAVKAGLIGTFCVLVGWNLLRVPLTAGLGRWRFDPLVIQATTLILLTAANIGISMGVILLNFTKAAESLRESEGRFRLAMQHSPIGMALVALDGCWLEVNPALCAIVGRTREELLGLSFQSVTHPEDVGADQGLIKRLVDRQVPSYRREKRYLHKDGRVIWVRVDVSIIFNADGTPQHLVSQVVDVTERKRTEQALHEHQAKLVMAMDTARLGHWEFDVATGRFTFDDNFYKLLGTSAAREGGLQMSAETYTQRFILPEEATVVGDEINRALSTTDPHYTRQLEHRFRRVDGSVGLMSVRFAIEKDSTGRTVRTYGLNQDITEQAETAQRHRNLEEQLRHAQKMEALGALAGGIAHDFNNILTGILGNLQLAEQDLPGDHPAQEKLREAGQASRRARAHVARILTFSRRYPGDRSATSLGPVVQEAVQLLRASLPATIEIKASVDGTCARVVCDSTQIHQVIMNLGTNSAHAMRRSTGLLEVQLQAVQPNRSLMEQFPQVKAGHGVRLTIRDNGCGMEKSVMARIFEPFYTTKAPGEGTGLGLAMVHGIVEDHGGAIVVTSTVGQGTTFDLYFPAVTDPPGEETVDDAAAPTAATISFGQGRKVMFVDDDLLLLKLGQEILTRCGFVPDPFSSPAAAWEKFQVAPQECAAVISDLTMPGMTGVDLARQFRALRPDVPFILASGYMHAEAHKAAQESGVTHFVHKPFEIEELVGKLRAALEPSPPV